MSALEERRNELVAPAARVLIVDDDRPLRELLCDYLRHEGFDVLEAADGRSALHTFRSGAVDIAILDIMLPGLDGLAVLREIRAHSAMPIILLSGRDAPESRIEGLDSGADDYVVKPFSMAELTARLRVQARRVRSLSPTVLSAREVELDLAARRCRVAGDEITLTRREFDLLAALLRSSGRTCTREGLLERVWSDDELSTKTVDVHVAGLRRKLGTAVEIATLRGVGYRLDPGGSP
jgi:two-component system response regulator RegX3